MFFDYLQAVETGGASMAIVCTQYARSSFASIIEPTIVEPEEQVFN